MSAAVEAHPLIERLLEQRPRPIAQSKAQIDLADRERERGLGLRLSLQLRHHALGSLVQNLPRRDRLAASLAWIGNGKDLFDEAPYLQSFVALGSKLVALPRGPNPLHCH